jgi:hypothetical protein
VSYRIYEAYDYYAEHILAPLRAKEPIYTERNIAMVGLVPSRDWEVMGAILVDDRGDASRSGSDLQNHEIKSAKAGGSFEYQYHRNRGVEKLDHDLTIEHVYVIYQEGYLDVDVYSLTAERFAEVGETWRPGLIENYRTAARQRYRKSIPKRKVLTEGRAVMRIRGGELDKADAGTP